MSGIYGLKVGGMNQCHNYGHVFCAFNVKYGINSHIFKILITVVM